jgi:hypothetical protein
MIMKKLFLLRWKTFQTMYVIKKILQVFSVSSPNDAKYAKNAKAFKKAKRLYVKHSNKNIDKLKTLLDN